MLTGRTLTELDANDLFRTMTRLYGMPDTEALFAVFGNDTPQNARRFGKASHTHHFSLTRADIEQHKVGDGVTLDVLLSDLCTLGELAPGEYVVRLRW